MQIDFVTFKQIFDNSFWNAIKESLVPFSNNERPTNRNEFLKQLYNTLLQKNYSPSNPREYIIYDKHNNVTRVVPTFSYRDYCVYFYCIKRLEEKIALNRIAGTFGGWRLGNLLREQEEVEAEQEDLPNEVSVPPSSFNKFAWTKHWREFQRKAYEFRNLVENPFIVKFDISNFYDSININILNKRLSLVADKALAFEIELLLNFLSNWNKKFEGYSNKTVGLPQYEIGDCSRILSNFYLQDYDEYMSTLCNNHGAKYLRYADDQLIFAPNKDLAIEILVGASKFLFRINLNVNSSKVKYFSELVKYDIYWAFEIFNLLGEPFDHEKVNKAAHLYFDYKENEEDFREDSVLKRLLKVNFSLFESPIRYRLLSVIYEEDFLATCHLWHLNRIAENLPDRTELFYKLDSLVSKINYNSYHYNLLKFNERWRPKISNEYILDRIDDIKIK